jgi:hypothetical protein
MLVSRLVYSSALKMGVTSSSKTSINFHRTTRRYIPEDRTLLTYLVFESLLQFVLMKTILESTCITFVHLGGSSGQCQKSLGYLCRILLRKYLMSPVLLPPYILRLRYIEVNKAEGSRSGWR